MDTTGTIRRLLGEYEQVRLNNQREGQRRELEVREKSIDVARLLDARRALLTQSMRKAFAGGGIDTGELTAQIEQVNQAIRDALKQAGFAPDYLQPVYRCAACRDTGYVGEPVHELCVCMKQRIMDEENRSDAGADWASTALNSLTCGPFLMTPYRGGAGASESTCG